MLLLLKLLKDYSSAVVYDCRSTLSVDTHIRACAWHFVHDLPRVYELLDEPISPTNPYECGEVFTARAKKFREQHLFGEEHIFTLSQHFRSTQTSSIAFVPLVNALSRHGLIEVVREAEKNVSVVLF